MAEAYVHKKAPLATRLIAGACIVLLYVPLFTILVSSFWDSQTVTGEAWTLEWYRRVFQNELLKNALLRSLTIAAGASFIATILGTMSAFALERGEFWGKRTLDSLTLIPLVMPELVMGLSLLIWFVVLRMTLGNFSILLAHVTFCISYVIVIVRSRLRTFDRSVEDAARDLGASTWQVSHLITLPIIFPAIVSAALISFTLSFDDFLISFYTTGVDSDTLPIKLYSMIKFGFNPEVYALSSLLLGSTLVMMILLFKTDAYFEVE